MRSGGKCPDCATLIPCQGGKTLTWHESVVDTLGESYLLQTASKNSRSPKEGSKHWSLTASCSSFDLGDTWSIQSPGIEVHGWLGLPYDGFLKPKGDFSVSTLCYNNAMFQRGCVLRSIWGNGCVQRLTIPEILSLAQRKTVIVMNETLVSFQGASSTESDVLWEMEFSVNFLLFLFQLCC